MAGTVTVSEERHSSIKKIHWNWTSTNGGAADLATTYAYDGQILDVVTIPGAAGVQPTDNYDITITDEDGIDVLGGQGANRSNATSQHILQSTFGAVASDKLTLNVTNAGNAKSGEVILYIR